MAWSDKCVKVPWQPPSIVFKIVWPILYALYALTIILERANPAALNLLLIGLAMNLCWVPLFIYSTRLALLLLIGMIVVAAKTLMILYKKNDWTSAALFSPYLAWLCFALTFNVYLAYYCV